MDRCLDDDECLSIEAIRFIQEELTAPSADIYGLLSRHYILGIHDEAAYYWPEHQIRLFRRGAVTFNATVHNGTVLHSDKLLRVPPESGVAIHHLSHQDVAQWIEKTNRYTSRRDRQHVADDGQSLARFAHVRIDHWLSLTRDVSPGGYPEAVAVLRATYDLVDRLKVWEEERGLDGAMELQRTCATLDAGYAALGLMRDRAGQPVAAVPAPPEALDTHASLRRRLVEFRGRHGTLTAERDAHAAEAARLAADLSVLLMARDRMQRALDRTRQELTGTQRALVAERHRAEQAEDACACAQAETSAHRRRADAIEASAFWRATAVPRRVVHRLKRVVSRKTAVAGP